MVGHLREEENRHPAFPCVAANCPPGAAAAAEQHRATAMLPARKTASVAAPPYTASRFNHFGAVAFVAAAASG